MNFNAAITWSPQNYLAQAFVAKEAELELLSRLQWMTIDPKVVIDLGCGTGNASQALMLQYPHAKILSIDANQAMLEYTQLNVSNANCLWSDASCLPLQDASVDLIFANFLLPWHTNINLCFAEWRRILRPNGLLMFSALGFDTLHELKALTKSLSETIALPELHDMHHIGDSLVQAKLCDPVLDVTDIITHYQNYSQLINELYGSGFLLANDVNELMKIQPATQSFSLTYEIIFAHAFAPALQLTEQIAQDNGDINISLAQFKKMVNRQS